MDTTAQFVTNYRATTYWWKHLDQPVLSICKEHSTHTDPEEVFAKVSLVNRVYRTNLQMATSNAEWKVAELFVSRKIDQLLSGVNTWQRFSRETVDNVVTLHEKLVELIREITNRTENSFCSKYLSFHFPEQVLIFDNFAYETSWKLAGHMLPEDICSENWNVDYAYHCHAVLELIDALKVAGIPQPDIKLLDNVLYGDRERNASSVSVS